MNAGPLVAVLLAYLIYSPPAWAQRSAYIHGRVLDPSQAAVPEAAITVVDQESGFRRNTQTASDGGYAVGSLESGTYKITVRKDGFRTMIRFNVKVANLEAAQVDFELSVGAVQETITVEDTAPQPGQEDAAIGAVSYTHLDVYKRQVREGGRDAPGRPAGCAIARSPCVPAPRSGCRCTSACRPAP